MFVEQFVDEAFEAADLVARCAVLFDERVEPFEAVRAGGRRVGVGVDAFEAAQPALDLARRGELVADLGGEFRDLVADVVQSQCAGRYQGSAVLEHRLDLGDQRVVDLQRLGGPQCRLGLQWPAPRRPRRRRRSPPGAASGAGLPTETAGPRGRRTPPLRARSRHALPTSPTLMATAKGTGQTICRGRVVEGGVDSLGVVAA